MVISNSRPSDFPNTFPGSSVSRNKQSSEICPAYYSLHIITFIPFELLAWLIFLLVCRTYLFGSISSFAKVGMMEPKLASLVVSALKENKKKTKNKTKTKTKRPFCSPRYNDSYGLLPLWFTCLPPSSSDCLSSHPTLNIWSCSQPC